MKKILVPTDFSANASRALDYAIELANSFGAVLHILHTVQTRGAAGHFMSIEGVLLEERQSNMDALLKTVRSKANENVLIEQSIKQGDTVDSICDTAAAVHADLIIMGTQGASGLRRWIVGSTTNELIKNTLVPVLAIPEEVTAFSLKRIAIAVDASKFQQTAILQPALALAHKFHAAIDLLHIVTATDGNESTVDSLLQNHLTQLGLTFTLHRVVASDVDGAILDFARNNHVELICLLNQSEQRSWWQNLFHTSVSEEVAFQTEIPLLVLHLQ